MQHTTIALIEDYKGYRELLAMVLEDEADLDLQWQFGSAESALRKLGGELFPDVVLLDLGLPLMGGMEALPLLRERLPDCKFIVMTQSRKESDVVKALSLGASGYLLKSSKAAQIVASIRSVVLGGITLDQRLASHMVKVLDAIELEDEEESPLTERELEILKLLADGLAQKQIAEEMDITERTVVFHAKNIYGKLQVPNAPAAVARAFGLGLLPKDGA